MTICATCDGLGTVNIRREDRDGARVCPDCLLRLWYTVHNEMQCRDDYPARTVESSDERIFDTAGELLSHLCNLGRA